MKRVVAFGLLGLAACTRTATPPVVVVAPPTAAATRPATAPPTFAGFPGWLGLAAVEGSSDADAPANALAHVALPDPQTWPTLSGQRFLALAPGYTGQIAYTETKKIPFGCDGREETFAFFNGTERPPRGAVWLGGAGSVVAPSPLAVPATAGPNQMRAWEIGGGRRFISRRTDKSLAAEIWEAEKRVWVEESPWQPMQGGDDVPPSLDGGPGVPIPRMVLIAGEQKLLVMQADGFEGTSFTGIHLEKGGARRAEGGLHLYWCAF